MKHLIFSNRYHKHYHKHGDFFSLSCRSSGEVLSHTHKFQHGVLKSRCFCSLQATSWRFIFISHGLTGVICSNGFGSKNVQRLFATNRCLPDGVPIAKSSKQSIQIKLTQLKGIIIFQTSMFGFHVNFPGCSLLSLMLDLSSYSTSLFWFFFEVPVVLMITLQSLGLSSRCDKWCVCLWVGRYPGYVYIWLHKWTL